MLLGSHSNTERMLEVPMDSREYLLAQDYRILVLSTHY